MGGHNMMVIIISLVLGFILAVFGAGKKG